MNFDPVGERYVGFIYQKRPRILKSGESSEASLHSRIYNAHDFSVIIFPGRCHTAISNLAINAHNFAPGCHTAISNLAINIIIMRDASQQFNNNV